MMEMRVNVNFGKKELKNKGLLSMHNSSVHSEKIFSCEECPKIFYKINKLDKTYEVPF